MLVSSVIIFLAESFMQRSHDAERRATLAASLNKRHAGRSLLVSGINLLERDPMAFVG